MTLPILPPSTICLPHGTWTTVLDCLCDHFPNISRDIWLERFARKLVLDANKQPLTSDYPYRSGLKIHYYREVFDEAVVPFEETIIFQNEHLLVADKPHFLSVSPVGQYVEQTLMARLIRRTGNANLSPIHRLDRLTAGLVMFSLNPESRDAYQKLFRERSVYKYYECLAPALPQLTFPYLHTSRMERGEPFFRMHEVAGEPNSETHIEVVEKLGDVWRYGLTPITGKQHQLRVHMASLGAPILNDDFYPVVQAADVADDYDKSLKLLAKRLVFTDPLTGQELNFESHQCLGGF